jgi:hypothetical protein
MVINLAQYIVRLTDGSLDLDSTTLKFQADCEKYEIENKADNAAVKDAIHAVFDQYPSNINMPALVSLVAGKLGASPAQFETIKDRVADVIHASPEFKVAKGRNGGVSRPVTVAAPPATA